MSFIANNIRTLIINSTDIKKYNVVELHNDKSLISFEYDGYSVNNFKNVLEGILTNLKMNDLMVAEDTEAEYTLAILKKGDLEQFGLHICKHCGMTFSRDDEKILHEKIHYFI